MGVLLLLKEAAAQDTKQHLLCHLSRRGGRQQEICMLVRVLSPRHTIKCSDLSIPRHLSNPTMPHILRNYPIHNNNYHPLTWRRLSVPANRLNGSNTLRLNRKHHSKLNPHPPILSILL